MQRLKIVLTAFCILLFSASFAIASGDGDHGESWLNLLYRVITVALVIGIVYRFYGKQIAAFFKGRTAGIAAEIESLETRKLEARKNLESVERRINRLDDECQAILAEYTAQGEAMKAAIIAQAEKSAAQITASARASAQNETNAAIEAMRAEMAEKIIEATEKLLAKKLSASEHTKLVDKYLTKVVLN